MRPLPKPSVRRLSVRRWNDRPSIGVGFPPAISPPLLASWELGPAPRPEPFPSSGFAVRHLPQSAHPVARERLHADGRQLTELAPREPSSGLSGQRGAPAV